MLPTIEGPWLWPQYDHGGATCTGVLKLKTEDRRQRGLGIQPLKRSLLSKVHGEFIRSLEKISSFGSHKDRSFPRVTSWPWGFSSRCWRQLKLNPAPLNIRPGRKSLLPLVSWDILHHRCLGRFRNVSPKHLFPLRRDWAMIMEGISILAELGVGEGPSLSICQRHKPLIFGLDILTAKSHKMIEKLQTLEKEISKGYRWKEPLPIRVGLT